jgi:glutamate synthase domain-containing protein 3
LMDSDELATVYELVREHFEFTASSRAEAVLDLWDVFRGQFWKVAPRVASIVAEARSSVPGQDVEPAPSERANAPSR